MSSRNIALYFACQALAMSSVSLLAATSAIVGATLAPDPRLATVPAAMRNTTLDASDRSSAPDLRARWWRSLSTGVSETGSGALSPDG